MGRAISRLAVFQCNHVTLLTIVTSVRNRDSGLAVYKAAQLVHVARGQAQPGRRRLVRFIAAPWFRHGKEKITGLGETNPAGAPDPFLRAEPDALPASPRHHFSHAGVDSRRLFRRELYDLDVVTLKELAVVEQDDGLRFALDEDREIGMRNQEPLTNA